MSNTTLISEDKTDLFLDPSNLDELTQELQCYFWSCYKKRSYEKKELNREILAWSNLADYEFYRNPQASGDEKIRNEINNLYSRFGCYLDTSENYFTSRFKRHFKEVFFELNMARFASQVGKLKEHEKSDSAGDLRVDIHGLEYILECTTGNPTKMDLFFNSLNYFSFYFNACEFLKENDVKLIALPSCDQIFKYKERIEIFLNQIPFGEQIDLLEWIYLARYAYFYFKEILPIPLKNKIENLFEADQISENASEDFNFISNKILPRMARDKLKKAYSQKETPVILSLGLSNLPCIMTAHRYVLSPKGLISIAENIKNELELSIVDHRSLKKGVENLYAIIIQTVLPNFIPEDAQKNCYGVIYNKTFLRNQSKNIRIFEGMIEHGVDFEF